MLTTALMGWSESRVEGSDLGRNGDLQGFKMHTEALQALKANPEPLRAGKRREKSHQLLTPYSLLLTAYSLLRTAEVEP
jgi:hypothetical protein